MAQLVMIFFFSKNTISTNSDRDVCIARSDWAGVKVKVKTIEENKDLYRKWSAE